MSEAIKANTITLTVKNFRAVKDVKIQIGKNGKVLLYGPNGAGKSSVIHTLLTFFTKGYDPFSDSSLLYGFKESSEIKVEYKDVSIKLKGGKKPQYECNIKDKIISGETDLPISGNQLDTCLQELWNESKIENIGYIRADNMVVYNVRSQKIKTIIDEESKTSAELSITSLDEFQEWRELTSSYKLVYESIEGELLKDYIIDLIGLGPVYNGYIYDSEKDEWYAINKLAYGQRRALMILYALAFSDLVVIEAFDNGLHVNLAIDLLELATKMKRKIIIETHTGFLINWFLKEKDERRAYYIEGGISKEITTENIGSQDLFKTERELLYGQSRI